MGLEKPSADAETGTFITASKVPAKINKTPKDLLDKINTLEMGNLSLIEQTQEAETGLESLRTKNA